MLEFVLVVWCNAAAMGQKIVWIILGCAVMAGCATQRPGKMRDVPEVIAHRGASAYAPENTLAAFELAWKLGADWFELDVTLTKDGEIIVIHDDTVDRTTDGKGAVRDLTLAELKQLDAGSWKSPAFAHERLPVLGETLDFARGRIGVYVEIKNSDDDTALEQQVLELVQGQTVLDKAARARAMALVEASGSRNLILTRKVIKSVRDRRMTGHVVIQSFSPIVCLIALAEAPRMRTEFLGVDDKKDPAHWEEFLRWGYLIRAAGFNVRHTDLTEGRLAAFHEAGRSVGAWTVNKEADMKRLAVWGVDSIITDQPDLGRRVAASLSPSRGRHRSR